jgi:hypothetical protein
VCVEIDSVGADCEIVATVTAVSPFWGERLRDTGRAFVLGEKLTFEYLGAGDGFDLWTIALPRTRPWFALTIDKQGNKQFAHYG